jgi:hypothetical protein
MPITHLWIAWLPCSNKQEVNYKSSLRKHMDINLGECVISPDLVNLLLMKQLWQFFWYSKWYTMCMINKSMSTGLIWWNRSWLLFILIAIMDGMDILSFLYKEKQAYGVSIFIWLFTQIKKCKPTDGFAWNSEWISQHAGMSLPSTF